MKATSSMRFFSCVTIVLYLLCCSRLSAGEPRPKFEQLFKLNSAKMFGGNVKLNKVEKDAVRVTLHYNKPGQMEKSFEGRGMINPDLLKKSNPKFTKNSEGKDIKNMVVAGRGIGDWRSRFSFKGDIEMKFNIRIPMIQRRSQLLLSIHQTTRSYIQTSFFQMAILKLGGRTKDRALAPKEFQSPPAAWFDSSALVPVSISLKAGKFNVKAKLQDRKAALRRKKAKKQKGKEKIQDVELLSLDGAEDLKGGRLRMTFRDLVFVMSDLVITGSVDREWCEKEFDRLEARRELVLEGKSSEKSEKQPPRIKRKKREVDEAEREKEADVDL